MSEFLSTRSKARPAIRNTKSACHIDSARTKPKMANRPVSMPSLPKRKELNLLQKSVEKDLEGLKRDCLATTKGLKVNQRKINRSQKKSARSARKFALRKEYNEYKQQLESKKKAAIEAAMKRLTDNIASLKFRGVTLEKAIQEETKFLEKKYTPMAFDEDVMGLKWLKSWCERKKYCCSCYRKESHEDCKC